MTIFYPPSYNGPSSGQSAQQFDNSLPKIWARIRDSFFSPLFRMLHVYWFHNASGSPFRSLLLPLPATSAARLDTSVNDFRSVTHFTALTVLCWSYGLLLYFDYFVTILFACSVSFEHGRVPARSSGPMRIYTRKTHELLRHCAKHESYAEFKSGNLHELFVRPRGWVKSINLSVGCVPRNIAR